MQIKNSFIRNKSVDIKRYLPEYLAKDKNFKATLDAESLEHERLKAMISAYLDEQFVNTAAEMLDRYEDFVAEYHSDETDEQRRGKILAKYQGLATSTLEYLTSQAEKFSGQEVIISEDTNDYSMNLSVDSKAKNIDKLTAFIEQYKPAHLGLTYDFITKLEPKIFVGGANIEHVRININKVRNWDLNTSVKFGGGVLNIKVEVKNG